jgi:hypothetical protein
MKELLSKGHKCGTGTVAIESLLLTQTCLTNLWQGLPYVFDDKAKVDLKQTVQYFFY